MASRETLSTNLCNDVLFLNETQTFAYFEIVILIRVYLASKLDRGKSWEQNLSVLWVIPSLALDIELSLLMPTIDKTHNCFCV